MLPVHAMLPPFAKLSVLELAMLELPMVPEETTMRTVRPMCHVVSPISSCSRCCTPGYDSSDPMPYNIYRYTHQDKPPYNHHY